MTSPAILNFEARQVNEETEALGLQDKLKPVDETGIFTADKLWPLLEYLTESLRKRCYKRYSDILDTIDPELPPPEQLEKFIEGLDETPERGIDEVLVGDSRPRKPSSEVPDLTKKTATKKKVAAKKKAEDSSSPATVVHGFAIPGL